MWPSVQSVAVVPLGLTKYRQGLYPLTGYDSETARAVVRQLERWGDRCEQKYGQRICYAADEFYLKAQLPIPPAPFYGDFDQLENGVGLMASLKQEFLDACMAQSVIDTGIVPTVHDRILTLSTCTGNGHATRWVVQAVLRCEAPAEPQPEKTLPADSQSAQTAPVETVPEETAPEEGAENAAADSALQTTDEQQSPESAASEEAEPQSEAESTAPQTQQQEDLQEEPVTSAEEPVSSQTPQEGTENP